jgi:hypothetical protein
MYYRVAILVTPSPLWQWKSTVLGSLDALFQWLRLYHALPQDHLLVFSAPSREGIEEQFVRENKGFGSNSVTAAQFLQERKIRVPEEGERAPAGREDGRRRAASLAVATHPSLPSGIQRAHALSEREERERGAGGDHDCPYMFTLPVYMPQVLAWCGLLAKVWSGEIEP